MKLTDLTEENAIVLRLLMDILNKFVLLVVCIIAFFMVLHYLIGTNSNPKIYVLGILEGILAGTMFTVVLHYFPAIKAAREASKRKRLKKQNA